MRFVGANTYPALKANAAFFLCVRLESGTCAGEGRRALAQCFKKVAMLMF